MTPLDYPFARRVLALAALAACLAGCGKPESAPPSPGTAPLTIGVSFETLQTEFWVAALDALKQELASRHMNMVQAIADGDASRQIEQVRGFITRKVDGIILVPKDAQACVPILKAANAASIPIVLFNRPAAASEAKSVAVVADNVALTRETVNYLIGEARKTGRRHKALLIIGDLGDINAIGRREGFQAAARQAPEVLDVVAEVPSEWNQEKAQAGVVNALQASPDISFIFTSSDFLLPSIVSALKAAGRYHPIGQPGHVWLGGFDGDATAYQMLRDGYLDATGVQDVYFEVKQCVDAIVALREGRAVAPVIQDPGFVIHQGNLKEKAPQMWGAKVRRP